MKKRYSLWLLLFVFVFGMASSCKSSAYPCPKDSGKRTAKVSKNDDGSSAPVTGGRKRSSKGNNGLVKKKEPKRIHKRK